MQIPVIKDTWLDANKGNTYGCYMNMNISVEQLKYAITIREKIEALQEELAAIVGGGNPISRTGKRKMSASARAKIGAAQKARWAKQSGKTGKSKYKMSASARAAISAAAKARWKKAKAAGKSTL
jgi:hypothetical protein